MLEFVLASGNSHKAQEFAELLEGKILVKPAPRGLNPDECGSTFIENALIKAKAYYDEFKVPALADDSGLSVEALPEILGVQSARFLPEKPSYQDKGLEVIRLLEGKENRRAHFTCVICCYLNSDEIYFFEGRVQGEIGFKLSGSGGFGYDPIFIPTRSEIDGKSLAELPEWKNQHSHRARAAREMLAFLSHR